MAILPRLAIDRRFVSAAFSAAIHIAALTLLLLWHFSPSPHDDQAAMTVIDLPNQPPPQEAPPPPPPQPQPTPGSAKPKEAAPPAPRAEAAPLAKAIVPLVPSFTPAPIPATGNQPAAGAAQAGTGTGAGGAGDGTGGGGTGGGGAGEGTGEGTEPVITRGDFKPSDYPKALRGTGPRGRTWTEVMVAVNGRPLSCRVTRSSGTPLLDGETCRIIMQRFRFRPGRDAAGRAVVAPFEIDIAWEYLDLNER